MNDSTHDAARRLEHLDRVFVERRARLASDLFQPEPVSTFQPVVQLQRHGYPVAFALASAALLPTLVGLLWRRRKLFFSVLMTALRIRKWRSRLKTARIAGDAR